MKAAKSEGASDAQMALVAGSSAGLQVTLNGGSAEEAAVKAKEESRKKGATPQAQATAAGNASAQAVISKGGTQEEANAAAGEVAAKVIKSMGGSAAQQASAAANAVERSGGSAEAAGEAAVSAASSGGVVDLEVLADLKTKTSANIAVRIQEQTVAPEPVLQIKTESCSIYSSVSARDCIRWWVLRRKNILAFIAKCEEIQQFYREKQGS